MTLLRAWQLAYWIWAASEVLLLIVTRTSRKSGSVQDRGSLLVLWPVIFGSIWFALQYGAEHTHTRMHAATWLFPFSFGLLLVGVALRWTAIYSLGRSFSVNVAIHSTQTVYKKGLYSIVRHPSYTAMLIIFLAIGLGVRNWISLAVILIFPTLALLYRIHVEEAALLEAFGEDYASYSRATPRLIPGVY